MDNFVTDVQFDYFRRELKSNQSLEIKVRGGCMWPFYLDGVVVVLKPVHVDDIKIGEVIVTYADGRFFCHRVFRKANQLLQTKADALVGFDACVSRDQVLGQVVARKKRGQYVQVNSRVHRWAGYCIVWTTLLTAPFYPILRSLKKNVLQFKSA